MAEPHTPVVHFTPVFVEPTIAHSLLRSESYVALAVLELTVALALVYAFFSDEIKALFARARKTPSPLEPYAQAALACTGNALVLELPEGRVPALALNGQPVVFAGCDSVLRRINGPRKVHLVDVLGRR
ncbi:putative membrane protein-like protein [Seal parapoxvirus]|uniref:Putative membrane protein-like protein n=1 Tax=Seal parapoxvirus TaxID=187984 RepID=A0A1Z3GCU9_9POXV|nr:putative membrane protein-like protein [Seal parapoxvirus]ASC55589.1 putative membrane protein-like protein [Seal parapoxvirus]